MVINGSIETIEFGFNQNTKDRAEGGIYVVKPGDKCEVPDGALSLINHSQAGPGRKGLVVLKFGDKEEDKRLEGLNRYIAYLNDCMSHQHQRTVEEEQVGKKSFGKDMVMKKFEDQLAKAEAELARLTGDSNGNSLGDGKQSQKKLG